LFHKIAYGRRAWEFVAWSSYGGPRQTASGHFEHGDFTGSRVDVKGNGAAIVGRVVGQRRSAGGTVRGRSETGRSRFAHQRFDGRRAARGRGYGHRPDRRLPSAAVQTVQTYHFGHVESEF